MSYYYAGKWSQCLKTILKVIYKKFTNDAESPQDESHSSGLQQLHTDEDDTTEESRGAENKVNIICIHICVF